MKRALALALSALAYLAACAPQIPISATAAQATVVPVTVLPGGGTPLVEASPSPPTPVPSLPSAPSPTALKYRLLAEFPDFFYCDPDYYPVARGDELQAARDRMPELRANAEEFNAILAHNGLAGQTTFTDDQTLLIYRQHKMLAAIQFEAEGAAYRFNLRTAEQQKGQGYSITGLIDGAGRITVTEKTPTIATCPICLAAWTQIDTPRGPVMVTDLKVGDTVWTEDLNGTRIAAPVLLVSRTPVPPTHEVVHLVLSDGRELWASAGHPTTDGRRIGELRVGDSLDGATIVQAGRMRYGLPATYDLLPGGPTGWYWADGVLLASTLAGR